MSATRIALVTESFRPVPDGATRTVRQVLDRLVDTGHEVLVVAPGPGLTTYRGSRIARIDPRERLGRQVRAALDGFDPDLVQVTSPGGIGRRALDHAARHGVPTLVVQQDPVSRGDGWRRQIGERADQVVVTCHWMRARLGALGVDAPVWEPGVDPAAFTPALRDQALHATWSREKVRRRGLTVVGYVGGLARRHGVGALASARTAGTRLVVIGDGPQRRRLTDQLPGARFTGALGTGDLAVALASLDVLVHPGELETCAHPLREAAASGVPVVAAASGGHRDVVTHDVTGLLYSPTDPSALRHTLTRCADPGLRARLGSAARVRARQRTWAAAVDELVTRHHGPLLRAGPAAA